MVYFIYFTTNYNFLNTSEENFNLCANPMYTGL